jgi:hypothetical protein
VHDLVLVNVVHGFGELQHEIAPRLLREPAFLAQVRAELVAFDQLHDHECAERGVFAEVDDRDDVRVRERAGDARFTIELRA